MANAIQPQLAQAAREVTDAQDHSETDDPLTEFRTYAVALRNGLYQDRPLNEMEFLFMDNQFHVVEMAYLRWKRKHGNVGH